MNTLPKRFVTWLMSLTIIMRYLVVAMLCHIALVLFLGSISIVVQNRAIPAIFTGAPPPLSPPATKDAIQLGTSDGVHSTRGINRGGIRTIIETTRDSSRGKMTAGDRPVIDGHMQKVLGIDTDGTSEIVRHEGVSLGNMTDLPLSFNAAKIASTGMHGSGTGFDQRHGADRAKLIGKTGGSDDAERAVFAALRWLQEQQNPNGSWNGHEALSALATLCFLGHGETADSPDFGPTVSKALSFLVSVVGQHGIVNSRNMYSQGAVTLALAEAYGMTQSPLIREPLERAVSALVLAQKTKKTTRIHEGGWRYTPTSSDADTSVSGWLIMGLKSAKMAGLVVPDEVFEMASRYLWNMYGESGGFGYSGPGRGYATTAVGILCQQFLGQGGDRRVKRALDYYLTQKVDWQESTIKGHTLYAWYYATQAMFQGGGSYWEYWNKPMQATLVKNQQADGHWTFPVGSNEKSHGPIYSTTLCCLMLEVYYRYLPLYLEMEKKASPPTRSSARYD